VTPRPAERSLRDLIDAEAPVPPGRAASVAVAVARHLERIEDHGQDVGEIDPDAVVLREDGSVELHWGPATPRPEADPDGPRLGTAGGAAIGRLLFELLIGRPPLGREDAFEPAVLAAYAPSTCSLLARSLSDAPGQWPDAAEWRAALESEAKGLAPPLPPDVVASDRRRRALVGLGVAVLAVATLVVLALAPGWWASVSP